MAVLAVFAVFFLLPGVIYSLVRGLRDWRKISSGEKILAVLTMVGLALVLMSIAGLSTLN